jgi:hypothetical protein
VQVIGLFGPQVPQMPEAAPDHHRGKSADAPWRGKDAEVRAVRIREYLAGQSQFDPVDPAWGREDRTQEKTDKIIRQDTRHAQSSTIQLPPECTPTFYEIGASFGPWQTPSYGKASSQCEVEAR